ncbi:MAG: phospho-N-acetylmuramoyl-pentapeptide-transferase, partial [Faecalibacillus sp.]
MGNFIKLILAFVLGLLIVLVAMPKVIPFLHKMKFGQVEREEGLESHKKKGGTPTMGGVVFVVATVIGAFIANINGLSNPSLILITIVLVGYSLIGLIDDALIVLKHHNEGLKAWQKFLMQAILAISCYYFLMNYIPGFTTVITIPLVKVEIDLGWLYAVLVFIMFTGESNGVNLSDGLDGLATGLSMVAIAPYVIFAIM